MSIFGNIQYTIISQAVVGLEVAHWETEYKLGTDEYDTYKSLHAQTSFILYF